ncbi:hypothetical protein AMR42_09380 [Limnothrix sp. PR1529]|uniref:DUF928 domain-containing protein n=1 Tax=Limnothrix sp. PR1529 TaxID=1704291 RepID=UPI00081E05C4|nr:DUF928 domain-containing protein [Limnothrix sp. PR1529]OCQ93934.1 hypothetical protein BCR12_05235 [Limnothrix sp. P13C2]PIB11609.1 hypothetical protein AMR42_09380 [Limnothrix sp. PR1529]
MIHVQSRCAGFGLTHMGLVLGGLLAGVTLGALPGWAIEPLQPIARRANPTLNQTQRQPKQTRPPVRGDRPINGRGRGAGSYSGCTMEGAADPAKLLVALVPQVVWENGETVVLGETRHAQPGLWFYVGYPAGTVLEWELQDADGYALDQQRLVMGSQAGLLRLPRSPNGPGLAPNRFYSWYLRVNCANRPEESVDFVAGTIIHAANAKTEYWLDQLDRLLSPGGQGRSPQLIELLDQEGFSDLREAPLAAPPQLAPVTN